MYAVNIGQHLVGGGFRTENERWLVFMKNYFVSDPSITKVFFIFHVMYKNVMDELVNSDWTDC